MFVLCSKPFNKKRLLIMQCFRRLNFHSLTCGNPNAYYNHQCNQIKEIRTVIMKRPPSIVVPFIQAFNSLFARFQSIKSQELWPPPIISIPLPTDGQRYYDLFHPMISSMQSHHVVAEYGTRKYLAIPRIYSTTRNPFRKVTVPGIRM